MSGSIFGDIFKISTFGESHGKALGVVIDGCPAGIFLSEDDFTEMMGRRKPGGSPYQTSRKEEDSVVILSGVFQGQTTGTPLALMTTNQNQQSRDYNQIKNVFRPSHADYTFYKKYGIRDYRGGGRSSGRETAARVMAGVVAKKILSQLHINVTAYTHSIGEVAIDYSRFDIHQAKNNPFYMPDQQAAEECKTYMDHLINECNSVGGIVAGVIENVPPGIGDPVFDKLDACLAKAMFSIGAVKGFEIGAGFAAALMTGKDGNDLFYYEDGQMKKTQNNAGGILGGISDGHPIYFKVAIKPVPSIASNQKTVNENLENIEIAIKGRHDPVIVPRVAVVCEAMAAVVLVDLLLKSMTCRMDLIKKCFL